MTKQKATKTQPKRQLYNILRGIESDTLNERHEAGEKNVDLSAWPKDVIENWLKIGVIEKAE